MKFDCDIKIAEYKMKGFARDPHSWHYTRRKYDKKYIYERLNDIVKAALRLGKQVVVDIYYKDDFLKPWKSDGVEKPTSQWMKISVKD